MTEFLFIRHGQTDWNVQQRFQGQADPPLNETGVEQARRLGRRLAAEEFDLLVSSDLWRARQTAEPLVRAQGPQPLLRCGLREQAFGALEGLDGPTAARDFPQVWACWQEHRADYAIPGGGESAQAFRSRVMEDVRDLARTYAGARLVIVTHGGVLDMLWRTVHALPLDGPRRCEIPNTGLNRLVYRDGTLRITKWGDAAHLEGLRGPTSN